ncbi:MAG: glutamyl-tRNA reductase [Dethiobacter sp.]|jgi:glutamyl-tRNA reductase|nr:MAG: glutamyl-tRNA reductase [Dethiobacter sp.]
MPLVLIGINHKQACLELREKFSLEKKEIDQALNYLLADGEIRECFLLSTCNRTELYAICNDHYNLQYHFFKLFRKADNELFDQDFERFFYVMKEEDAVRHLFQVACGLDSMVLGETQILGQLKDAYNQCKTAGSTGILLHSLCQKALSTGKKVHTQTSLGEHAVSFGYATVEIARRVFQSLENHTLMVIGTGEMAKLTLQNLFDLGAGDVIVASRRKERGKALAARFKGKVLNFTRLEEGLRKSDVIICATNAPHYIITLEKLAPILEEKKTRPQLIIDLGVPRNVEPAVDSLEGVYLYNLDDLESLIAENIRAREQEAKKAGIIVNDQVVDFIRWYRRQRVIPFVTSLHKKAESIRQEKLQQFSGVSRLTEKEQQLVDKLTRSLVNSLIRDPVFGMKDFSLQADFETAEHYAYRLFGLEKDSSFDQSVKE